MQDPKKAKKERASPAAFPGIRAGQTGSTYHLNPSAGSARSRKAAPNAGTPESPGTGTFGGEHAGRQHLPDPVNADEEEEEERESAEDERDPRAS